MSSDIWRIAMDVTLMPYEEAISTIRGDLLAVEESKQEFASTSELSQIETLLTTLESKLQAFKRILPKPDSRRGLMNFGGKILKTLFGTAVVSDVTSLHDLFDELQSSQKDVIHSLTDQLTYVRRLDTVASVNVEAISNLSSIIKDIVINSQERARQTTRDIMWLNLTIHGQSTLFMTIRQLEFSILRLIQQLDELINAVQHATTGKLPMTLVDPVTLHNILKNVSLRLPEGYELVAGTKYENIHLYYDCMQTAIVGDPHHIKMILNVPLKTVNRHFMLYRILALPTRISNRTFVQYVPDFLYFGIDYIQRNYILFTEADLSQCSKGSITVCSADKAIYNTQIGMCESSPLFQTTDHYSSRQRNLLLHYKNLALQPHGSLWVRHCPMLEA